MATTLEELERRITRMEQELARLQQLVEKRHPRREIPAWTVTLMSSSQLSQAMCQV